MIFDFRRVDCWTLFASLPDASVDLVIVDPPFSCTNNPWDEALDHERMWRELRRATKPGAASVFFATIRFAAELISSNPKGFRHDWVWHKNRPSGHLNAKKMPLRAHEHVLVFADKSPFYEPQFSEGEPRFPSRLRASSVSPNYRRTSNDNEPQPGGYTRRYPRSVIEGLNHAHRSDSFHPTQKPVELLRYLVRTYSRPGDIVLDFCAGSAATGVAALREGRRFVGAEPNPEYFARALDRLGREIAP